MRQQADRLPLSPSLPPFRLSGVAKLPQIDEAAEISPYGHDDGSEEVVDSLPYSAGLLGAAAGGLMVREQISPHETSKVQASLGPGLRWQRCVLTGGGPQPLI